MGASRYVALYRTRIAHVLVTQGRNEDALSELDRAHQLREGVRDCYLNAIKNCAHYAVELDEELTSNHRKYLRTLLADIAAGDDQTVLDSRATFRNLLRDYRDKGTKYLADLRDQLAGSARALEEILDSLSLSDGEHEVRLRGAVQRLRSLAVSPESIAIRAVLRTTTESIEQSVEEMRKQHQVTISQFQIEMRTLHQRIDTLESAASLDTLTRYHNRDETIGRINAATSGEYCLVLVAARGLRRAELDFGSSVSEELAGAFSKRLRNSLPPNSILGRWGMEELLAIVQVKKTEALATGKWITEHLSGAYACLQNGKTVRPALQLNVAVVETVAGETPAQVLERVAVFLTGA